MDRRAFIKSGIMGAACAAFGGRAIAGVPSGWRQFEVNYRIALAAGAGPARLWVPVPQDALDYQRLIDLKWQAAAPTELWWEPVSRAPVVMVGWPEGAGSHEAEITVRIATRDRSGVSPNHGAEELPGYLRPTASSPTDGIVLTRAREIVGDRTAPLDKARAIYDWVIDNTFRRAETRGCGLGNVAFMLESGDMGGKCADINSLYVGLAKAAGLPARDVFGIRVADSAVTKSLGKSGDVTKAQHCRAEVHIERKGWFPVDPADVRKVVLEEGLPVDGDKVRTLRERLFGNWEMNWVGFNYARDLTLPGQKEPPLGFLMYPYAEAAGGDPDPLDPTSFAYTITAKEIT